MDSYEGAAQTEGDVERDCGFGWRGDAAPGATGPGPLVQAHKQSPGVRDPARASEQFTVGDDEGKAVGEIDFGDREVRARTEQGVRFVEDPVDRGQKVPGAEPRSRHGRGRARFAVEDVRDAGGCNVDLAIGPVRTGGREERVDDRVRRAHRGRGVSSRDQGIGKHELGEHRTYAAPNSRGSARQRSRAVTSRRGRTMGSSHRPCAR